MMGWDDVKAMFWRMAMGPLAYGALSLLGVVAWSERGLVGSAVLAVAAFSVLCLARQDVKGV